MHRTDAPTQRSRVRTGAAMLISGLALLTAGCATSDAPPTSPPSDFSVGRGRFIAETQCAGCHAVGQTGESRAPTAPAFRNIRMRYNLITFQRRMAQVGDDGHYEMPGFNLDPADVDDIAAYIETFKEP